MSKKIIGVICPDGITFAEFSDRYSSRLDEAMQDPHTHFIFSASSSGYLTKYISGERFRECTIYHTNQKLKSNTAKFQTKGGFSSNLEILEAIRQDSTEVIEK
jgi:hypothetical protein